MGKIVFLGDSVTASANVSLAAKWAQLVAIAAGYAPADIIIMGYPGEKSAQILTHLPEALAYLPDKLVLMPTVNDGANGVLLSVHVDNYSSIIEQAQAAGIEVVIVTPPIYRANVAAWRPWHGEWLKLAAKYKCHLVDVTRAYGWERVADVPVFEALYVDINDVVHQSLAGNSRIAALCGEPIHAGAFVKAAPVPPASGCPECTPPSTELQLASLDLLANGATVARLERLRAALPA